MKTKYFAFIASVFFLSSSVASAQNDNNGFNQIDAQGNIMHRSSRQVDSLGSDKQIPTGIKVWTVDERFGDRTPAILDTIPHMFMNSIFTTGMRGEYNTTGNLGAPRTNRIFIDQPMQDEFIFTKPYDFFITPVSAFHFTNTLSPITNITYNTSGDRTDGEDHFTTKFAVNAGKKLGIGFKFDYIYGRGYYQNQSTSHFNYSMYGSYLGEKYQAHLLMSTNHQKVTENGGIADDNYITHPESFQESYQSSEIPTVLARNWNRNDNQHVFFTQRYSLGFKRKVPMTQDEIKARKFAIESKKENDAAKAKLKAKRDARKRGENFDEDAYNRSVQPTGRPDKAVIAGNEPARTDTIKSERISVTGAVADSLMAQVNKQKVDTSWLKDEYVPVTSFIHTLKLDNYRRIYEAYQTPDNYYSLTFPNVGKLPGDSIYDKTTHYRLKNTFAISLLEGFNKWAKAGLKAFLTSDLRHYTLPDSTGGTNTYNEHNLSIGAQISKTQGKTLHFNATAETWLTGEDSGQLRIDGKIDLNFPLFGDTVTLATNAFFHRDNPSFYFRHYHSKHFWWDYSSLSKTTHSRIQGIFSYQKTHTTLRFAVDELDNLTYFGQSYTMGDTEHPRKDVALHVRQGGATSLLTVQLEQNFNLGPLYWENVITYQKSSKEDVIAVPDLNIYSNLYLHFKIARVLKCDLGGDIRYFSKYYAPDYSPALGSYTIQEGSNRVKTGNYPIINVYANFHLKHTRFFVMMSHINAGSGKKDYFLTPHYPINDRILRFGLSWNFFN